MQVFIKNSDDFRGIQQSGNNFIRQEGPVLQYAGTSARRLRLTGAAENARN
jgi:hypothetical protein